jgi:hypothetical protein
VEASQAPVCDGAATLLRGHGDVCALHLGVHERLHHFSNHFGQRTLPSSLPKASSYLPVALSALNVITVLVACATSFPSLLRMSQTYRLTVFPRCTGFALARSRSFHTGRKKLICRSKLVKLSPSLKPVA